MSKYKLTKEEIAARNTFILRCCIRALELIAEGSEDTMSPADIARCALLALEEPQ